MNKLSAADVWVHSGDFTMTGSEAEAIDFMIRFCDLPHKHFILLHNILKIMPRIRRHQPGKYKATSPKEFPPNFTGVKPLTVFQAESGKWGAKAGDGSIEISPVYELLPRNEEDIKANRFRLGNQFEVIEVTPDDWDLLAFYSPD